MEKVKVFIFKNKVYNIIDEIFNKDYEVKITDITRIRNIFAWKPWWIDNQFRFLKKFQLIERLKLVRCTDFDSGWTYQSYWKPWVLKWDSEEIL